MGIYIYVCHASAHALRMRRIIIIIITCIYVQWVAMVFLVYREGMQLPLVAMVLREASALMRISSYIYIYIYIYIYPSREPSAQS